MGYVGENTTASRYNTRWESTTNETYASVSERIYQLLREYERYNGTISTGKAQPMQAKLPDSYPKGNINSLLGLEEAD